MTGSSKNRKPNRLLRSTSPYLLQHAYNPVDWYEWGSEALARAKSENKPILVSIGYSSCHWCHVMERESFENSEIAAIMNEQLVCIKVDREERPDIDQIYMEAVQAMGLNGGWPLNVFLTPDQKPFYGGTYFQPMQWSRLITLLSKAFNERRSEINRSADELTRHLNSSQLQRHGEAFFSESDFHAAFNILESKFDSQFGGMDRAPKFVMPTIWLWLLRYHHHSMNTVARDMVLHTLRRLSEGGIYDQLGGGFSRYSVDARWFAPHFEKMLYDNAQLLSLYAEAFRVSPDPAFQSVVYETVGWLEREMRHPEGGFYSALDADSEGEEGKFYTWTQAELNDALGPDAGSFNRFFQATNAGNWEDGRNILYRIGGPVMEPDQETLGRCKLKLLKIREERVAPGLDDKILTGWNAMLITGLTDAFRSFGDPALLDLAIGAARFIETKLMDGLKCYRSYKERRSESTGFLEDYAHLIQAWLALYECTFDEVWVYRAAAICEYVISQFKDTDDGFFFVTSADAEKLIARKKDLFDNVIPSPNSVMARNLFRLGVMLDREEWRKDAVLMAKAMRPHFIKEPGYLSNWGIAAMETTLRFYETVVTGPEAMAFQKRLLNQYHPFSVLMGAIESAKLPLVKDRVNSHNTLIHVCVDNACQLPVGSVHEALQLLSSRSS